MATIFVKIVDNLDNVSITHQDTPSINTDPFVLTVGSQSATVFQMDSAFRFPGVNIPKNSTINTATVTGIPAGGNNDGTVVRSQIFGEAADDAARLTSYADYTGRARTAAVVPWNPIPAWTDFDPKPSPDISSIIAEITSRDGWESGNAIMIFWEDDGTDVGDQIWRRTDGERSDPANTTELDVDFTEPAFKPQQEAGGKNQDYMVMP